MFCVHWKMAEKRMGSYCYPSQILSDQQKSKTRVNMGSGFPQWSMLKDEKALKRHAEVVTFLLGRYANVC